MIHTCTESELPSLDGPIVREILAVLDDPSQHTNGNLYAAMNHAASIYTEAMDYVTSLYARIAQGETKLAATCLDGALNRQNEARLLWETLHAAWIQVMEEKP